MVTSWHQRETRDTTVGFKVEMAILKVPWCDFVVWTVVDIHIERIYFDHNFWEDQLLPKLDSFYVKAMVPEILIGFLYHSLNMQ